MCVNRQRQDQKGQLCPDRHHTNPVGTEWRWKMDLPEKILLEAVENHQNMF